MYVYSCEMILLNVNKMSTSLELYKDAIGADYTIEIRYKFEKSKSILINNM